MRVSVVLLLASLSVALFAETVTKNSAAFSFPTTVGVVKGTVYQSANASFVYRPGFIASDAVILSWALPVKPDKGVITIFSVSGAKVKSFPIASASGTVKWDFTHGKKPANGVYFASLSSGSLKKNLKIILY